MFGQDFSQNFWDVPGSLFENSNFDLTDEPTKRAFGKRLLVCKHETYCTECYLGKQSSSQRVYIPYIFKRSVPLAAIDTVPSEGNNDPLERQFQNRTVEHVNCLFKPK